MFDFMDGNEATGYRAARFAFFDIFGASLKAGIWLRQTLGYVFNDKAVFELAADRGLA
jgi:hypothetical protein